jgi:hypothetical protein
MIVKELLKILDERPNNDVALVDLLTGSASATVGADSYRGYYEQIALEPVSSDGMIARALANDIRRLMRDGMEGYKGGHFVPGEHTAIWVAQWGDNSGIAVLSSRFDDGGTTTALLTAKISDY